MSDRLFEPVGSLKAAKSKANYLFEGDFRRRPNQNLAGASQSLGRVQLLKQAAEQRQNREDVRQKELGSVKIQSVWRSHSTRKVLRSQMRNNFDKYFVSLSKPTAINNENQLELIRTLQEFTIFHHSELDQHRLRVATQFMVQHIDYFKQIKDTNPTVWLYKIVKLIKMDLKLLDKYCDNFDETNLQFIMHYTSETMFNPDGQSIIWRSLIKANYFKTMRKLANECNIRAQVNSDNIDNHLSRLIIELIRRSLNLDFEASQPASDIYEPILNFFDGFIGGPLNEFFDDFYIPILVNLKPTGLNPKNILSSFKISYSSAMPSTDKQDSLLTREGELILGPVFHDSFKAVWHCYTFVKIMFRQLTSLTNYDRTNYLNILANLLAPAEYILNLNLIQEAFEDPDELDETVNQQLVDDDDDKPALELSMNQKYFLETRRVITKLVDIINNPNHIETLKPVIFDTHEESYSQVLPAIIRLCNLMLAFEHKKIFSCPLLLTLAFNWDFLKRLWKSITSFKNESLFGECTPIYLHIARGTAPASHTMMESLLQKLKVFCSLLSYSLPTLDDEEFYTRSDAFELATTATTNNLDESQLNNRGLGGSGGGAKAKVASFVDKDLVKISAILRDLCVGLIEILCQENRQSYDDKSQAKTSNQKTIMISFVITTCFKALVRLVCQIHGRDSRKQFCSSSHWICSSASVPANKAIDFQIVTSQQGRLLDQLTRVFCSNNLISTAACEIKTVLILQEIPFVIPFADRVQILHLLIGQEKRLNTSDGYHFGLPDSAIFAQIRRNYIYEDAFEKLSYDNEPNLKMPLKISLINAAGAHEAGIDGGGLSKEFLTELIKAGFNPMRGFFKTTKDHKLYPNPSAKVLFSNLSEGYEIHYEFLGRIIGKAMFDKVMVELPLASFFLAKLLARKHPSDVDWHNLASLDPVLYKNLVYLKNYQGDVSDLNLDFSITNNELDEHEVVELKPGGSKILVSTQNKVEYIHLVSDYRLNKQIRAQCAAFKRGLSQLIDLDWLRMFDPRELQILISGAPTLIDMEDWRRNTVYANGYADEAEVIQIFWRVASQLDEEQKRKLLRFATSCSYPPLLGFKDLYPQFTIAPSEGSRLPTASTCMNLLKLPECKDENTMRSKLLYAINSNAGFELS